MASVVAALRHVEEVSHEETYSAGEATRILGITYHLLYRYVNQGQIRSQRVLGKRFVYYKADVDALATQRERWSAQAAPVVIRSDVYTRNEVLTLLGGMHVRSLRRLVAAGQIQMVPLADHRFGYLKSHVDVVAAERQERVTFPFAVYTASQVACLLGVGADMVRHLARRGAFQRASAWQHGQQAYYVKEDVDRYLEERQRRPVYHPDEEAFARLYDALFFKAVGYLIRHEVPLSEAEDVAQEAFQALWEDGRYFMEQHERAWVPLMMKRIKYALGHWRYRRFRQARLVGALAASDISWCRVRVSQVEKEVLERERLEHVMQWSRRTLSSMQQRLLWLVVMGYSNADIQTYLQDKGIEIPLGVVHDYRDELMERLRGWFAADQESRAFVQGRDK